MIQAHGGGKKGFQRHRPGSGLLERQALGFLVLRRVHRAQDIDHPAGHRLDHRKPVVLGAQGRGEFEEGAVITHVQVVQRQVVDRNPCRHIQPAGLGAGQRRQAGCAGHLIGVVAGLCHLDQGQIPVQPHAFGQRMHAGQAAQAGEFARRDRRTRAQAWVLRMADHQRAQAARIGQGAGQNLAVGHHMVGIGKGNRPGIQQKADFRHLAPLTALGQGGHVADAHRAGFGRAAGDEFQRFGRVDGRRGVGAGDDRGHTPCRRRQRGRAEGFAVPLARLADLHAQIDNAGGKALTAAVNHLGRLWRSTVARRDQTVRNGQAACRIGQGFGVDQAGICEVQNHGATIGEVARTGQPSVTRIAQPFFGNR